MINKSYSYLVPLLNTYCEIDPTYFILMDQSYAIVNKNTDIPCMAISYEKTDNEQFVSYLKMLENHELTMNVIESEDKITFIFKMPEEFTNEYKEFINGKFSRFSQKSKDIIIDYVTSYHKPNTAKKVKMVLYKDQELRRHLEHKLAVKLDADLDLTSIPKIEEESFNYNTN